VGDGEDARAHLFLYEGCCIEGKFLGGDRRTRGKVRNGGAGLDAQLPYAVRLGLRRGDPNETEGSRGGGWNCCSIVGETSWARQSPFEGGTKNQQHYGRAGRLPFQKKIICSWLIGVGKPGLLLVGMSSVRGGVVKGRGYGQSDLFHI